jgi:deazaflavin-dependent oxidoreductase (nitroreductase family)
VQRLDARGDGSYRSRARDNMDASRRPVGLDHPIVPKVMRAISRANVWLYQRTGGRLGGTWRVGSAFPRGVPILLLTTMGRKSGEPRTTPLLFLEDAGKYVVVASQGGLPKDPLWYLNVRADPHVRVQVGPRSMAMRAREASVDERAQLWPRLVAHYADFETYQAWTERTIPVVLLEA